MTAIERKMAHFDANAPRCTPHFEKPKIGFDGIHFITCPRGCEIHDAEHSEPDNLMLRWDQLHR